MEASPPPLSRDGYVEKNGSLCPLTTFSQSLVQAIHQASQAQGQNPVYPQAQASRCCSQIPSSHQSEKGVRPASVDFFNLKRLAAHKQCMIKVWTCLARSSGTWSARYRVADQGPNTDSFQFRHPSAVPKICCNNRVKQTSKAMRETNRATTVVIVFQ